jgi:hypothetical protein
MVTVAGANSGGSYGARGRTVVLLSSVPSPWFYEGARESFAADTYAAERYGGRPPVLL